MAAHGHILKWQRNRQPFRMPALLQLVIWGASASSALTLVVFAAVSDGGSQRLMMAMSLLDVRAGFQMPSVEHLTARAADAENETRRLADAVRTLGADRERLLTRLASLEHALDDITGSIKRQTAATPPVPPSPTMADAEPTSLPGPAASSRVAGLATPNDGSEARPATPEFGIDIGSAVSFDALRLLWNATKGANAALFQSLRPIVVVRENPRTRGLELRLVAGPVGNADTAARLCGSLSGARRSCQPAPFAGGELSLAPEAERPPVPAPASRPSPKTPRPM
jgi:hypothetical protein